MKFIAPLTLLVAAVAAQDAARETSTVTSTLTSTFTSTCTVKYATVTSNTSRPSGTAPAVPVGNYPSSSSAAAPYPSATNVYPSAGPTAVSPGMGSGSGSGTVPGTNATRPAPPVTTFTGSASSQGPQAFAAAVVGIAALLIAC